VSFDKNKFMPNSIREVLFDTEEVKELEKQLFSKRKQLASAGRTKLGWKKDAKTYRNRTTLNSTYQGATTGYKFE
jgi:hypothetical protein